MSIMNSLAFLRFLKSFFNRNQNFSFYNNLIKIKRSSYFNEDFYLQNNPDVKASGIPAIKHYMLYGAYEGRNPSDKFNSKFYLETYSDVLESGMNPLVHYLKYGMKENRHAIIPEVSEPLLLSGI